MKPETLRGRADLIDNESPGRSVTARYLRAAADEIELLQRVAEAAGKTRPESCACSQVCYDCTEEEWRLSCALATWKEGRDE